LLVTFTDCLQRARLAPSGASCNRLSCRPGLCLLRLRDLCRTIGSDPNSSQNLFHRIVETAPGGFCTLNLHVTPHATLCLIEPLTSGDMTHPDQRQQTQHTAALTLNNAGTDTNQPTRTGFKDANQPTRTNQLNPRGNTPPKTNVADDQRKRWTNATPTNSIRNQRRRTQTNSHQLIRDARRSAAEPDLGSINSGGAERVPLVFRRWI